ncbi:hypothetical protein [Neobacillus soli]|uniref:hypothetical protein n=1 Tax=Neobacillus soli TaxID=220688 RepID=UPI000BB749FC|nr:hypothetical protein [Neobacillus soli]
MSLISVLKDKTGQESGENSLISVLKDKKPRKKAVKMSLISVFKDKTAQEGSGNVFNKCS